MNNAKGNNGNGYPEFECTCNNEKKYRLTLDGGSLGPYVVEYCQKCFDQDDRQYLLLLEEI